MSGTPIGTWAVTCTKRRSVAETSIEEAVARLFEDTKQLDNVVEVIIKAGYIIHLSGVPMQLKTPLRVLISLRNLLVLNGCDESIGTAEAVDG